jgi:hypothetical protein
VTHHSRARSAHMAPSMSASFSCKPATAASLLPGVSCRPHSAQARSSCHSSIGCPSKCDSCGRAGASSATAPLPTSSITSAPLLPLSLAPGADSLPLAPSDCTCRYRNVCAGEQAAAWHRVDQHGEETCPCAECMQALIVLVLVMYNPTSTHM